MAVRKKKKKALKRKVTKTVTLEIPDNFVEVNLPIVIQFEDYHDIQHFADTLEIIMPGVKHRELGLAARKYQAIFFTKKGPDYKKMVKDTEAWIEQWHAQHE